jgi:ABC-type Fe3+ transport system substrate-binding protein
MHPAQMVSGAENPGDQPLITIMPYFFTRTITESSPLIAVWPEDGALAAPILLVTRADRPEIQPLIDTIAGESMSRVLSKLGLFPSTHPENDDFSPELHPLQWPGWEQLLSQDLPEILARTTETFQQIITDRSPAVVV